MNELKAYNSERIYWAVEQVEREAGDIADLHLDDNLFYLKSEADKVIADLKESHKMEVEQLLLEIAGLKDKALQYKVLYKEKCRDINNQERHFAKQLYHNKYKRCLAMAWWCDAQVEWYNSLNEDYSFWLNLYVKWQKRWLEIAEKFKEAK